MAKGGGGSQTSTVHQSNLPEYAQPYYEALMERGFRESQRPYQTYGGSRLAGMSEATQQGLSMADQFARSGFGDLNAARDLTGVVANQALGLSGYEPAEITSYYRPGEISYLDLGFGDDIQRLNAETFGEEQATQYMSPYMQQVVDRQVAAEKARALEEQAYLKAQQATTGAFGGSRGAVQQAIAAAKAQERMGDIEAEGHQAAYENAQQQFERDRTAKMLAAQGNLQAALQMGLSNQDAMLAAQQLREQAAQAAGEMDLTAQQASEQFRQSGRQLGLQGLQLAGQSAGQLADMQEMYDNMSLQRIQAQLGIGQTQEDYRQQMLDMGYEDFINQRDAERQNLQFLSSLLQGVPISANYNTVTNEPSNPLAGVAGTMTGLQALYALGRQ